MTHPTEDLIARARAICAEHDPNKAYQYVEGQRDDYMPMTAVVAALQSLSPIAERAGEADEIRNVLSAVPISAMVGKCGWKNWEAARDGLASAIAATSSPSRLAGIEVAARGWQPISEAKPNWRYMGAFKAPLQTDKWEIVGPGNVRDGVFCNYLGKWPCVGVIFALPSPALNPSPPAEGGDHAQ